MKRICLENPTANHKIFYRMWHGERSTRIRRQINQSASDQ